MVPIFVILTVITCIGIKSLAQRVRRTHTAEERRVRRVQMGIDRRSFLKVLGGGIAGAASGNILTPETTQGRRSGSPQAICRGSGRHDPMRRLPIL